MNFITFVFSLLLIFSFGTFLTLEKQSGNHRLRATYLGHVAANRKILSQQMSETYQSLRGQPKVLVEKTAADKKEPTIHPIPEINPECARINLWPLIQEGKERHPFLYEVAVNMLDHFYGSNVFKDSPQTKTVFLNAFLKKAKVAIQKNQFCLEKLALDPSLQMHYYKLLKGTKEWKAEQKIGYPSFLDVFKVDETPSKVCLLHAHPGQIMAILGSKVGKLLFSEIQAQDSLPISRELIEKVYAEAHLMTPDPDLFTLIEMGRPAHPHKGKTTLIAQDHDTHISLRKNVYIP